MSKIGHELIQEEILKHLFETARLESATELSRLIRASHSETLYHLEELRNKKHIEIGKWNGGSGETSSALWRISQLGRKTVMES